MLMNLPHDIHMTMALSHLSVQGTANLRCATRDPDLRILLLHCMFHARCTIQIQRVVRGIITRNANPAATFVALVYRTAQTLLRRVQDGQTQEGTPLVHESPAWIFHLYLEDGAMLFVPAATRARQREWLEYDLENAESVKWLEICAPWCNGKEARHSHTDILTLLEKYPGLREHLHRLASDRAPNFDVHTPSDGIALF